MKRKNYDTVSEAMNDLYQMGYTTDFSMIPANDTIEEHHRFHPLSPTNFEIDHFYRFEGDTDPGDEMIVYAISSLTNKTKGLIVNAYGVYADNSISEIVKKLTMHSH